MYLSSTQLDHLISADVKFLPHYGPDYGSDSDTFRYLIVGESHFRRSNDGWFQEELDRWFSREVVSDNHPQATNKCFRMISRLLTSIFPGETLWKRAAFYNYVQATIDTCGDRPTPEMWKISKRPFIDVLCALKPKAVLFVTKESWNNFTRNEPLRFVCNATNGEGDDIPMYEYEVSCGHKCLMTYTFHPSMPAGNPTKWESVAVHLAINAAVRLT